MSCQGTAAGIPGSKGDEEAEEELSDGLLAGLVRLKAYFNTCSKV